MNAHEALDILEANWQTGTAVEALVVLRKAVKERDALKAEVEQYKADALGWKRTYRDQQARAERAEADLLAARPLLEAALAPLVPTTLVLWADKIDRTAADFNHPTARILRAALAYRAQSASKEASHD